MPRPLSTSIQEFLLDPTDSRWPIDWAAVFGREAPLVLEIGFGNGQFLLEQALANPDRNHVGIELSWSGATRLFKRLAKHEVTNARALLLDAELALQSLFRPESLDEVFVNHPCPWPKARHIGRRLLQPDCLRLLADRMRMGTQLTIVTDHAEYASWLTEVLLAQDLLASCHPTVEVDSIPGRNPTKYQLKAMEQGIPIHFFQWEKVRAADHVEPPVLDPNLDMPSLTLRGTATPDVDLFDGFQPLEHREEHEGVDTIVRVLGAFRRTGASDEQSWLCEALVQEDKLRQEFGVFVVQRRSGDLLLKLSGLGRPHPTHGVKRAVHEVGSWLRERHPGLELAHENLGAEATGA